MELAELSHACLIGVLRLEEHLISVHRIKKCWVTKMSEDESEWMRVERSGGDFPIISISILAFINYKQSKNDRERQRYERLLVNLYLHATKMTHQNLFEHPSDAVKVVYNSSMKWPERKRVKPEPVVVVPAQPSFIIQHIVAVTETMTGKRHSVAVMQGPETPTIDAMVQEATRILTERILNEQADCETGTPRLALA